MKKNHQKEATIEEKQAEIMALKKKDAEEIISQIEKILKSKNATMVPIVQIVGDRITYEWSISIP